MSAGRKVFLTESVVVVDSLGTELLPKGTRGEVLEENEQTLTLAVGKNTYTDIPVASTEEISEDDQAA